MLWLLSERKNLKDIIQTINEKVVCITTLNKLRIFRYISLSSIKILELRFY